MSTRKKVLWWIGGAVIVLPHSSAQHAGDGLGLAIDLPGLHARDKFIPGLPIAGAEIHPVLDQPQVPGIHRAPRL